MPDMLDRMRMELRRGVLVLAVLAALRERQYGYALRKRLIAANIDIEEGTLYPLIRRLESCGLLESEWSTRDGRKRRYYRTSDEGRSLLETLHHEWDRVNGAVRNLLEIEG